MSKAARIINVISQVDMPSDLYAQLIEVIRNYEFESEEIICPNCNGSGTSKFTGRLCTACGGSGANRGDLSFID